MPVEKYAPLVQMIKLSIIGICGDEDAKIEAHHLAKNIPLSYLWTPSLREKFIYLLDNQVLSERIILGKPDKNTIPFKQFERDPAPISQIKKIVNALHHLGLIARAVDNNFLDSETGSILHHAHEASRLLVHPDVDLTVVFGDDVDVLMSLINHLVPTIYDYTSSRAVQQHAEKTYRIGHVSGQGIYQLNRHRQNLDYSYLIALTLCIPEYTARLSNLINRFAEHREEARALDEAGRTEVLNWFDGLEVGGIRLSHNKLYRHLVRPMLDLPTSLLNEVTHLHGVSQTVVREKLIQFKQLASQLIAFANKCEDTLVLKRGLLSDPLIEQLKSIYDTIIRYVEPVVNMDNGLLDLLVFEDHDFIALRTAPLFERWSQCQRQLLMLNHADKACSDFFNLIKLRALHDDEDEFKQRLAEYYIALQPHVAVLDIKLSNQIVQWLTHSEPANQGIYTRFAHYWFDSDSSLLRRINLVEPHLLNRLAQLRETQLFQQALISDGMVHAYEQGGFVNAHERVNEELNELYTPLFLEHMTRPNQHDIRLLAQDKNAEARATYIIKKPVYSTAIKSLRGQFNLLCTQLNPTVQNQLKSRAGIVEGAFGYLNFESGQLPFPELESRPYIINSRENANGILSQPAQLLGMKRLANCLYHLEEACIQVESLDDTHRLFLWRINQLYRHINQAHALITELREDSYLSTIAGDMIDAYTDISNALGQVREDYLPADEPNTVFRVINAMTLLPQQINQFETGLIISPEQVAKRHQIARRMTDDITSIIQHSDSYVRLFLDSRIAVNLFNQLTGRLQVLLTSSHDVILNNLAVINDELLTNILLEADCWEEKLCLQTGKLSGPVKQILDTYYLGLLSSLQLPSEQYMELATNNRSLNKRLTAARTREADTKQLLDTITPKNKLINDFFSALDVYELYPNDDNVEQDFVITFQRAIPVIQDVMPHCFLASLEICNYDEARLEAMQALMDDYLLQPGRVIEEGRQFDMIQFVKMAQAYFNGLSASQDFALEAISYTKSSLEEQMRVQVNNKQRFIQAYITTLIDKKLARYPRPLNRYHTMLFDHIESLKETIVEQIGASERDIPTRLNQLLVREIKVFKRNYNHLESINYLETINPLQVINHLEAIKLAIANLKIYLDTQSLELVDDGVHMQTSAFESRQTLHAKYRLLRALEGAVSRDDLTIPEQILMAHDLIRQADFKTTLLAYEHYDAFTFGWLSQCLSAFLELIRVYKPERKAHCESLVQLSTFSRHGFFDASLNNRMDDAAEEDHIEQPDGP